MNNNIHDELTQRWYPALSWSSETVPRFRPWHKKEGAEFCTVIETDRNGAVVEFRLGAFWGKWHDISGCAVPPTLLNQDSLFVGRKTVRYWYYDGHIEIGGTDELSHQV